METSTSNQVIDLVKMISLTVLGGILAWVSVWLKMKIDNRKEDKEKKYSLYRNIATTLYNINRYAQNQEKSKLLFSYHQKLYNLIDKDPEEKSIQKTQAEYHQQTQAKLHYILLDQLYT